jgi:hypothetical protein
MTVVLPADERRVETVAYDEGQPLPLVEFGSRP